MSRTNADKRRTVRILLTDPERVWLSDYALDRVAHVSRSLVQVIRKGMGPGARPAVRRAERQGKAVPPGTGY